MANNAAFYAGPEIATESEARIVGSSAYARASHVMAQLSHQTYTVERLFNDCAQRGRHSLAMHTSSSVAPSSSGAPCLLADLAREQQARQDADVADLQRLARQKRSAKRCYSSSQSSRRLRARSFLSLCLGWASLAFECSTWASLFLLRHVAEIRQATRLAPQTEGSPRVRKASLTQRLNLQRCSKLARMTQHSLKEFYSMWSRLGRVMASGAVVDVDFGVGTLRCEDLAPSFDFTQRLDPT